MLKRVTGRKKDKKAILELSKRKDSDNICWSRKKLRDSDVSSIGINYLVYINDILCICYKKFWSECKKNVVK